MTPAETARGLTEAQTGYKVEPGSADIPFHTWWIKGPRGGVHIWARQSKLDGWPTEWIGGVECHWAQCPDDSGWFKSDSPSQADCWLLDGPCWHDGSSLFFSEQIAPLMPHPDSPSANESDKLPHKYIGLILNEWYRDRILQEQNNDRHP